MNRTYICSLAATTLLTLSACALDDGDTDGEHATDTFATDSDGEYYEEEPYDSGDGPEPHGPSRCVDPSADAITPAADESCPASDPQASPLAVAVEGWPWSAEPVYEDIDIDIAVDCAVLKIEGDETLEITFACVHEGVDDRVVRLTVAEPSQRFPLCEYDPVTLTYREVTEGDPDGLFWSVRTTFSLTRRDDGALLAYAASGLDEGASGQAEALSYAQTEIGCADACSQRQGVAFANERTSWTVADGTTRHLEGSPYAARVVRSTATYVGMDVEECGWDLFGEVRFDITRAEH